MSKKNLGRLSLFLGVKRFRVFLIDLKDLGISDSEGKTQLH
jgi:hypothetical protein